MVCRFEVFQCLTKVSLGSGFKGVGWRKKKKKKIVEESHPGLILGRSMDRGWTSKEEE